MHRNMYAGRLKKLRSADVTVLSGLIYFCTYYAFFKERSTLHYSCTATLKREMSGGICLCGIAPGQHRNVAAALLATLCTISPARGFQPQTSRADRDVFKRCRQAPGATCFHACFYFILRAYYQKWMSGRYKLDN